jgi:hypothetical protein
MNYDLNILRIGKDYKSLIFANYMKLGERIDREETKKGLNSKHISFETNYKKTYDVKKLIEKEVHNNPNAKKTYLFIPGWKEGESDIKFLKKKIEKQGNSWIHYIFEPWILSSNYKQVLKNFKYIEKEAKRDLEKFHGKKIIIGVSLGAVAATMIFNSNKEVDKLIELCPSYSLSEALWFGIRTQNIKKSFENQGITLKKLKELWKEIEPGNNLPLDKKKRILIFNSKCDTVIPYYGSRIFIKKIREKGLKLKVKTNSNLGHYGTIAKFYLPWNRWIK